MPAHDQLSRERAVEEYTIPDVKNFQDARDALDKLSLRYPEVQNEKGAIEALLLDLKPAVLFMGQGLSQEAEQRVLDIAQQLKPEACFESGILFNTPQIQLILEVNQDYFSQFGYKSDSHVLDNIKIISSNATSDHDSHMAIGLLLGYPRAEVESHARGREIRGDSIPLMGEVALEAIEPEEFKHSEDVVAVIASFRESGLENVEDWQRENIDWLSEVYQRNFDINEADARFILNSRGFTASTDRGDLVYQVQYFGDELSPEAIALQDKVKKTFSNQSN